MPSIGCINHLALIDSTKTSIDGGTVDVVDWRRHASNLASVLSSLARSDEDSAEADALYAKVCT